MGLYESVRGMFDRIPIPSAYDPTSDLSPFAQQFIHPHDAAALLTLQRIPFFARATAYFMRTFSDDLLQKMNMANKVRLGPTQLPKLHEPLVAACEVLGVPEPQLYLEMDPNPNAYVLGHNRPSITITSGLVDHLDQDEMQAAIAHECGHILCHHVLYQTMATSIVLLEGAAGDVFGGPLALAWKPVVMALLYWARQSELSADRAAAVVTGGARPIVEVMIRFAGGRAGITEGVSLEAFVAQGAAYYEDPSDGPLNKLMRTMALRHEDHPFPAVRAHEINAWCRTEAFERVMRAVPGTHVLPPPQQQIG